MSEDKVEFIIDVSDDESDTDDSESGGVVFREPPRLKQWFQSGARGPRPIAGNKRVGSGSSVSSYESSKSSSSSPTSETAASAAAGLTTAADLHESDRNAFTKAWATATPFFNPDTIHLGPQMAAKEGDGVMTASAN